jgi:hypothetical protein
MSESRDLPDNPEVVHEESDVDVRTIIWFGVGLAAVALTVHVFLWWLQGFYASSTQRSQTVAYPMAAGQQDQLPPEPRLQNNPQQELRELKARQYGVLEGYGWVNKEAGVARIPIAEAMRAVVQRGLAARETPPSAPAPDATKTRAVAGPSKSETAGHGQ